MAVIDPADLTPLELEDELARLVRQDIQWQQTKARRDRGDMGATAEVVSDLATIHQIKGLHDVAGSLRRAAKGLSFRARQLQGAGDEPPEVQPIPESRTVRAFSQRFTDRLRFKDLWNQPPSEFTRLIKEFREW